MEQTLEAYTENRIRDLKKLSAVFPDAFNVDRSSENRMRLVYGFEEHLLEVKEKLEKFFKRKLTWKEIETYTDVITFYIQNNLVTVKEFFKSEITDNTVFSTNANDFAFYLFCVREKFCQMIGCPVPTGDEYNAYINYLIKHNEVSLGKKFSISVA